LRKLQSGLVGLWNFDEGTGTALADIGYVDWYFFNTLGIGSLTWDASDICILANDKAIITISDFLWWCQ
jgi:hypothetical protein